MEITKVAPECAETKMNVSEQATIQEYEYAEGDVACRCCGIPIGKNSAAYRNGRRCLACANTPILDRKHKHNMEKCAKDRDAIVALYKRMEAGDQTVWGEHTMPSGRIIEATPPEPEATATS